MNVYLAYLQLAGWVICCAIWWWCGYQWGMIVQRRRDHAIFDDFVDRISNILLRPRPTDPPKVEKPDYLDRQ